ncbi:MAG TPA: hypothetical protein VGB67_10245 [Fibrella sp.]|jgi:hypothetical protein
MAQLEIGKDSLYGLSFYVRNLLRGGISTDDDSFPLSMLQESIVTVSAELIDQELDARYLRGKPYDLDLLVKGQLKFVPEDVETESPVVYLRSARPRTAQWFGNPAVKYVKSRRSPAEWGYAESEIDALGKAVAAAYQPARPAYWFEGEDVRAVLPLKMGLIREAEMLFIPARLDTRADGTKLDLYEDPFPLPARLWEKVWTTVFQRAGGMLIKTQTNRDEVNNGADVTVVPK